MKENEDFEITHNQFSYKNENDLFGVRILKGDFADVEYTYGTIQVSDKENEDGSLSIMFDYDIRKGSVSDELTEKFENTIGSILNLLIEQSLKLAEEKYNREIRNTNS